MAVAFAPLVFRGLSITLPRVLTLASGAALAVAATTAASQAPTWSWSGTNNGGRGRGASRPPHGPQELSKVDEFAIQATLNIMMMDFMEKLKNKPTLLEKEKLCRAIGELGNHTKQDLILKDKHEWFGHFEPDPPLTTKKDKLDHEVVHRGSPPNGSKAGVAYAGNGWQWILAWHVPFPNDHNQSQVKCKIHVEYGREAPIDWKLIEKDLDESSNKCERPGASAEFVQIVKDDNGVDAGFVVLFYEKTKLY